METLEEIVAKFPGKRMIGLPSFTYFSFPYPNSPSTNLSFVNNEAEQQEIK